MKRKELIWKIVDFAGHIAFGILLPGRFMWQFLPDIFLPVLVTETVKLIISNGEPYTLDRTMPEDKIPSFHFFMQAHRFCHTIWLPLLVGVFSWKIGLQCLVHVLWDQVTHYRNEHRRSLWRIQRM